MSTSAWSRSPFYGRRQPMDVLTKKDEHCVKSCWLVGIVTLKEQSNLRSYNVCIFDETIHIWPRKNYYRNHKRTAIFHKNLFLYCCCPLYARILWSISATISEISIMPMLLFSCSCLDLNVLPCIVDLFLFGCLSYWIGYLWVIPTSLWKQVLLFCFLSETSFWIQINRNIWKILYVLLVRISVLRLTIENEILLSWLARIYFLWFDFFSVFAHILLWN